MLVFVHGAANSFDDAIKRAAYNQCWLREANLPAANSTFDIIAFSWPARSYDFINIVDDYQGYRHDQTMAQQSASALSQFLRVLSAIQPRLGGGRNRKPRRLNLLCHSMGNFMLGWAVDSLLAVDGPGPGVQFSEIVLAAADEPAGTFGPPLERRLSRLNHIGREITVYFNNQDVAMHLSQTVNSCLFDTSFRLGFDGPSNKANTVFFTPDVYEFVDCSDCDDYIELPFSDWVQRSHQYYRSSPRVRIDIASTLAGLTPPRPVYDRVRNTFPLFAPKSQPMV